MGRKSRKSPHREKEIRGTNRPEAETARGVLSVTPQAYGFLKQENNAADIFVPPQFLNGAMDGDEVIVSLLPPRRDPEKGQGDAGQVIEILKRGRQTLVGEVIAGRLVRPINRHFPEDIELIGMAKQARRGDWVEIKLLHDSDGGIPTGRILRKLGKAGEITGDLDAVCAEFQLAPPYSEEEEESAMHIVPREIPREDLRKAFTVTVDPTDAKDFDDAVSMRRGPRAGTVEIGVHISDVAAWIAPKTAADKGAAKRGFSCYLPGRTLPMLPRALTAKISLREGVDSIAHTVLLTVESKTGKVLGFRRCHSKIHVNYRLTYAEVQNYLDSGEIPGNWDAKLATEIKRLVAVTRAMRRYRAATEEYIEIIAPEVRILCDEATNTIQGLVHKEQREADFLVEECMLAANSAVGEELVAKGIAGIFRVHPEPEPEKFEELRETLIGSFGLAPGNLYDRKSCNEFLKSLPNDPRRPVIMNLFMRAMPRAGYAAKPELHYGLGKFRYAHFTSPIRRYADLTVHQQLWNADQNQRLRPGNRLEPIAATLCEQEVNSDDAGYAANDRLKLRYLEDQLGSNPGHFYEGVIARVFKGGFVADIGELGLYGVVSTDDLPGDYERFGDELRQKRGKQIYRCGDYVYLQLSRIDFARGSAMFRPAGR